MPNVFVIQENPRIDISPAMNFGKIVTILPPGDTNFSYPFVISKIRRAIEDSAQDGDFLLLTGDPVAIGIATTEMSYFLFPNPVRFLKWLPREMKYISVEYNANEEIAGE